MESIFHANCQQQNQPLIGKIMLHTRTQLIYIYIAFNKQSFFTTEKVFLAFVYSSAERSDAQSRKFQRSLKRIRGKDTSKMLNFSIGQYILKLEENSGKETPFSSLGQREIELEENFGTVFNFY